MKYKPLYTNILVSFIKNKYSIITNPHEVKSTQRAKVKEIGSGNILGVKQIIMEVRPEMIVHVYPKDGKEIIIGEETFYLYNISDILLVEED